MGGTLADFDTRFGMAINGDGDARWTYAALLDAQRVEVAVTVLPVPGGVRRVAFISIGPPPGSSVTWSLATAQRITRIFFPADSVPVKNLASRPQVEYLYRSARLAAAFPENNFVSATGMRPPAPAGMFNERCYPVLGSTGIEQCLLTIGQ